MPKLQGHLQEDPESRRHRLFSRSGWRHTVLGRDMKGGKKRNQLMIRRQHRKLRKQFQTFIPHSSFDCHTYRRECHANIYLTVKASPDAVHRRKKKLKQGETFLSRDKWVPTIVHKIIIISFVSLLFFLALFREKKETK